MEPSTEEILKPKNPTLPTPEYSAVEISQVSFSDGSVTQDEIDTYSQINPDIPVWLVGAILHFNKKHPHYIKTGCYGKEAPTQEQIAEATKTVGVGKSKKLLGPNYIETRQVGEEEWSQDKCKMEAARLTKDYELKSSQTV